MGQNPPTEQGDIRGIPGPVPRTQHALSESLAWAARVIAQVLEGASLNNAIQVLPSHDPALRAAAQDFSYNTLRNRGRVDVIAESLLQKPLSDTKLKALLLAALCELGSRPETAYTVVNQAVEAATLLGQPRARGLVNAVLRNYQRRAVELNATVESSETGRYAHPQWWINNLKKNFPGQWRQILDGANIHPPMTLRVNRRRTTVEAYLVRLELAGIAASRIGPAAVMLGQPRSVATIPGFSEGEVSVQDAGAQHAAPILDVATGMKVLDACAAPGGKSGHILELADCELTAVDVSESRALRITENLNRLHLRADVRVGDSQKPDGLFPAGTQFDRILLDAPCTASGVVRRHPDIRWLRREADLGTFARTQSRMLEALWPLLKVNGKLLYTTCSVFPVENVLQIGKFLERHADAMVSPLTGLPTGQIIPSPESDGFYYALLQKRR